jgi:hypothetical protein
VTVHQVVQTKRQSGAATTASNDRDCDIKATAQAWILAFHSCDATQGARHRFWGDWIEAAHLLDALRHFSNR